MSRAATKPASSTALPEGSFFALSLRGNLPALLRAVASELESGEVRAEAITWSLNEDRLSLTANIAMRPNR